MNKLLLAVSTAFLITGASAACADIGTATGTNGAQDNGHATGAAAAGGSDASAPLHRPEAVVPARTGMKHHKNKMHKGKMAMQAMDTNHDGMISKEEFMSFHAAKYDRMKKNKDGMVDVSAMSSMEKHQHN